MLMKWSLGPKGLTDALEHNDAGVTFETLD